MKKIKVKNYSKISKKTGRISLVKEHERTHDKIKNFIKKNIGNDLSKREIIIFVIKKLGIRGNTAIKNIATQLYNILQKREATKNNEKKVKKEELKDSFSYYFSDGYKLDLKSKERIERGDVFYNQKINKNETWKETLKRKDLEIVQVDKLVPGQSINEKGKRFFVKFMVPEKNGKNLKIETKKMRTEEILNYLKGK